MALHLQRFGSTPQSCIHCRKPRPLEQYANYME